jgi:hypothetical protein
VDFFSGVVATSPVTGLPMMSNIISSPYYVSPALQFTQADQNRQCDPISDARAISVHLIVSMVVR